MTVKNIKELFLLKDEDAIDWIESNKNELVLFAKKIQSFNGLQSKQVENKFFETLVKSHILYRQEFIEATSINAKTDSREANRDYEDYITHFFKIFPKTYRDIFKKLDLELFESIITKPISVSHYENPGSSNKNTFTHMLPFNLIQFVYLFKTKPELKNDATDIYLDCTEAMNMPITISIRQVECKTDIFEYFLSYDHKNWSFFAPLIPIFDLLSLHQQKIFVAVGMSELEAPHENEHGEILNPRNQDYNQKFVIESLKAVPVELLIPYENFYFADNIEKEFKVLINFNKINRLLVDKESIVKKMKI